MATYNEIANDLDAQGTHLQRSQFATQARSFRRGAFAIRELIEKVGVLEAAAEKEARRNEAYVNGDG